MEYPRRESTPEDTGEPTINRARISNHEQALQSVIFENALDCIIIIDAVGMVLEFNPAAERTFGYARADAVGRELADLIVPVALRDRHRQGLARHMETGQTTVLGRRIELPALRADGTEFPVELAITRLPGDGAPQFMAFLRDISERVRIEQLRKVRLAVTPLLAHGTDVEDVAPQLLETVCVNLTWDAGFFWTVTPESDSLCCLAGWTHPDGNFNQFTTATSGLAFTRGEGLPGRAWASGHAEWIRDVGGDPNFPRSTVAMSDGLHSAFACPVMAPGGKMLGVMEFFSQQMRDPDAELLETMATIAGQIGQFAERRLAEKTMRESEERFRALMDQAPFSMQILAPDGLTLRVNRAWSDLWGVTLDQISGYNIFEDPQLDAKGVLPLIKRAFAGETVVIPEVAYDPNDTIPGITSHAEPMRWVSAVAYPLKDEGGVVREIVIVHEDVSARRQAEIGQRQSEEKFRFLAETIPQLAWMADPSGHIFWYNRRWYEYTGTDFDAMQGWGWQSVHDPEVLPDVLVRWRQSLAGGEPFDMVFPIRSAAGEFRPFLTRVNPLRDEQGRILYWFGTNTDITDFKRMEEALRDADRRKDEFLATLAHELRNPLAPIRYSLQILKIPQLDPAQAERTREMMERQVHHLVRLVDDLLDVSRVVSGKIELRREPVELSAVIARAVEIAQPLIERQDHELTISVSDQSLLVHGDPVRLAQVVGNLLTNAGKYTEPHGHIWLTARREGNDAVLAVRDDGLGLAPDVLPRVFDLFVQGDHSAARSQGGLGIGLTLVKNLVELHGGTVHASSAGLGRGSEFVIRLPVMAVPSRFPAQDEGASSSAGASTARRLMVVDDNRDSAESLAILLRLMGHEVSVALDGVTAVAQARDRRPEMIFLDLGMPIVDGYEAARRIRAIPELAETTLVALTGWGQAADRRRTAEAGFDRHLVKPADPAQLAELIAALDGGDGQDRSR